MKTIYISLILAFTTTLSLQAQSSFDELVVPYADLHSTATDDFSFANDLIFGKDLNHFPLSTFNFQLSSLSPSEDWLTNRFGATYAGGSPYDDWLELPYSKSETGLKIPVGNGMSVLLLVAGLYGCIIIYRKKLRVEEFAL